MSTLNKIKPYLQRASELDSFEPLVAYYCRLHALNMLVKAQQNGETSDEHKAVLMDCLKRSEDRKQVVDLSNGQEAMEGFASKVFESADTSDRSGRTDKTTAANFWAAATLMEVCSQFYGGELPPDYAEKVRYAKYRAVTIRDCIRQGIDPSPPQDEFAAYADESAPYAGATAPPPASTPAPAVVPATAPPAAPPAAADSAALEAQQLRDQIARAEEAQRLREQIAQAEAAAAAPTAAPPAAPATSDEAQRLRAQIAAAEAAAAPAPAPVPAPSTEAQRLREQIAAAEAAAAARAAAPVAAPPAPVPTAPAPQVSLGPLPPGRPRAVLSDEAKAAAKKKTEFASSALDFDDAASARKLLREALAMLEEPI